MNKDQALTLATKTLSLIEQYYDMTNDDSDEEISAADFVMEVGRLLGQYRQEMPYDMEAMLSDEGEQ